MKNIVLTFLLLWGSVNAQTVFSFSGLEWGRTATQVGVTLEAAGLSTPSILQKATCKVKPECTLSFNGKGVRGDAFFRDNGLVQVWIFTSNRTDYDERAKALQQRYGAPLQGIDVPNGSGALQAYIKNLRLKWSASNGETLELSESGDILYTSGSLHKTQSNSVKF